MTFKSILTALVGGVASLALFSGVASAEWTDISGGGGTTIYTEDGEGAVILSCNASGNMALAFLLEGGDVEDALSTRSNRSRVRRGTIYVEGEEVFRDSFSFKPASQLAQTMDNRAVVRVYNAAVNSKGLDFDLGRDGSISINLPEVDEAFRGFASNCVQSNLSR